MAIIAPPPAIAAASGAIGSTLANFALFPLDVVTVRLQVQRAVQNLSEKSNQEPSTIYAIIKSIIDREGWRALFKGSRDDMVGTALQSFLYFLVYEILRTRHLKSVAKKTGFTPRVLSIQHELLYGAVAGMLCKLVTTPINNVVVMKQLNRDRSDSVLQCARTIYERKGILGLWSGYKATFLLSINPSLAYYFYQLLGSSFKRTDPFGIFLKGAVAKSFATILTYPLIQAKTRTQASKVDSNLYKDMWASFRRNGFRSWFDGINAQLLKGFFVQGITMSSKETIANAVVFFYLSSLSKRTRNKVIRKGIRVY